jgi:hypothetical protein
MTPLSRASGEIIEVTPTKLSTDVVNKPKPKGSEDLNPSSVTAGAQAGAVASTSDAPSDSTYRNQLAIQLVSFFFESVQRIFKVPTSADLSYKGFEVSFSTLSIPWNDVSVVGEPADDEDSEQDRNFEMMPAPSNAALHRYIRDLARVRMDLAAMQVGESEKKEQAVVQLEMRVKAEQELTQSWIRRVCKAAGALSIVDPAFSPRK